MDLIIDGHHLVLKDVIDVANIAAAIARMILPHAYFSQLPLT